MSDDPLPEVSEWWIAREHHNRLAIRLRTGRIWYTYVDEHFFDAEAVMHRRGETDPLRILARIFATWPYLFHQIGTDARHHEQL
jgi:hypothetical protein